MITVSDLTKTYKSGGGGVVVALDAVNLSLEAKTFASIVGTSGSGKSTLLSLLGGLERPTSGEIRIDDQVITSESDRELIEYRRHTIGFVFQSFNLVPNLSARENVMLPMEFARVPRAVRAERAIQLLESVGLTGDTQLRHPSRLSGGEQQRVAIARALSNHPRLILADEPTGNLDSKTGRSIVQMLGELPRSEGSTVIIVTHDRAIAATTDVQFSLEDGVLAQAA